MWQAFLELVWPSRYDPITNRERRIALLQASIAIAIIFAAGPEIVVAVEMTALLELLGAILFLTAMAAGAKLVALRVWSAICSTAFPVSPAALVRSYPSIAGKALALICVVAHATWCLAMALNCKYVGAAGQSSDAMNA